MPLADFADSALVHKLLDELRTVVTRPLRFMEVCGTHTMAFFESGLRPQLTSMGLTLLSGPGCPVCVTPQVDIDAALALAALPEVTLFTFGDMLRVPGTSANLAELKARGADIRVVYSPLDAVDFAAENPARTAVLLGVGFETTAPGIAHAVQSAATSGLANFYVLPLLKTVPQALTLLASDTGLALDGFLCPGHVSVVIGAQAYEAVCAAGKKPCVIAGFDPVDLAQAVLWLARLALAGTPRVENAYPRAVSAAGNVSAQQFIAEVFEPCDATWRGLGCIPGSGLRLREEYAGLDARALLSESHTEAGIVVESPCRCGEVLTGRILPPDCASFGTVCTPRQPLGACMVSQEGACRAFYRYGALGVEL